MFRKGTERQKQTAESEEQSIPAQPQYVAVVRQAGKPSTVHDVVICCGVNIILSKSDDVIKKCTVPTGCSGIACLHRSCLPKAHFLPTLIRSE